MYPHQIVIASVLSPVIIVLATLQTSLSVNCFTMREISVPVDIDDDHPDVTAMIPQDSFSTKVILKGESFAKERNLIAPLMNRLDDNFCRAIVLSLPKNLTSKMITTNFLQKTYWPHRDDTVILLAVKFDPMFKASLLHQTLQPLNAMFYILFECEKSSLILYKVCFTCNSQAFLVPTAFSHLFTDWRKTKEERMRNLNGFHVAVLDLRSPSIFSKIPCPPTPIHRYSGKQMNAYCQPQYLVTDALAKQYNFTPVIYPFRFRYVPGIPPTAILAGGSYLFRASYKMRVFLHKNTRQSFVFCRNSGKNAGQKFTKSARHFTCLNACINDGLDEIWTKREKTVVSMLLTPFDSKCWKLILTSFIITPFLLPMKASAVDRLFMATKILLRQSILLSQKTQVKLYLLLTVMMAVILTSAYEGVMSSMNISPEKENIGLETLKEMILLRGYKIYLRAFSPGRDEELKKQFLTTFQAQGLSSHWNSSFHVQVLGNIISAKDTTSITRALANDTSKFLMLAESQSIETIFLFIHYTNPNRTCYKMIEQIVTSPKSWLLRNRFNWLFLKSLNRLQETGLLDKFYAIQSYLIYLAEENNRRKIPEKMRLFKTQSHSNFLKKNSVMSLLLRPILIASTGNFVAFLLELLYVEVSVKFANKNSNSV